MKHGHLSPTIAFMTTMIPSYKLWIYTALNAIYPGQFIAVHGAERPGTVPVDVRDTRLCRDVRVKNAYLDIRGVEVTWLGHIWWFWSTRPDVIILQDGVRIASNYVVHQLARLVGTKVIYYGHGRNLQAATSRLPAIARVTEWIREQYLNRCDAIVVYSDRMRTDLLARGVATPIFVAPNTVDPDASAAYVRSISNSDVLRFRASLGVKPDQHVVCTMGRLVSERRVEGFVDVVRGIERLRPNAVHGLVIGSGPELENLVERAEGLPVSFVGALHGRDLYEALLAADVVYLPGRVGLPLVDSFLAGKPVVAHDIAVHSPEIDYLEDGVNGLLIPDLPTTETAARIVTLLLDSTSLSAMTDGAQRWRRSLTKEAMIDGFTSAIDAAMGCVPRTSAFASEGDATR